MQLRKEQAAATARVVAARAKPARDERTGSGVASGVGPASAERGWLG